VASDSDEVAAGLGAANHPAEGYAKGQPTVDKGTDEAGRVFVRESRRLGYRFVKRLFDIVFSALVIVCWWAVIAAEALLIYPVRRQIPDVWDTRFSVLALYPV
jgi:hypothetical protein